MICRPYIGSDYPPVRYKQDYGTQYRFQQSFQQQQYCAPQRPQYFPQQDCGQGWFNGGNQGWYNGGSQGCFNGGGNYYRDPLTEVARYSFLDKLWAGLFGVFKEGIKTLPVIIDASKGKGTMGTKPKPNDPVDPGPTDPVVTDPVVADPATTTPDTTTQGTTTDKMPDFTPTTPAPGATDGTVSVKDATKTVAA